jgi:hypothetical protein
MDVRVVEVIVLSLRPHGENHFLAQILVRELGGGVALMKRHSFAVLQPGAIVEVKFQQSHEGKLPMCDPLTGSLTCLHSWMMCPEKIEALSFLTKYLSQVLPHFPKDTVLYDRLLELLKVSPDGNAWRIQHLNFQLFLLEKMGCGPERGFKNMEAKPDSVISSSSLKRASILGNIRRESNLRPWKTPQTISVPRQEKSWHTYAQWKPELAKSEQCTLQDDLRTTRSLLLKALAG